MTDWRGGDRVQGAFVWGLRQNFTICPTSRHLPTHPNPVSSTRMVLIPSPSMVSTNGPIHRPSRSHSTATGTSAKTFHAAAPRALVFSSSGRDDNDRHATPLSENSQQQRGGFWLQCIAHTIAQGISELRVCEWGLLRALQRHTTLVPVAGADSPALTRTLMVLPAVFRFAVLVFIRPVPIGKVSYAARR